MASGHKQTSLFICTLCIGVSFPPLCIVYPYVTLWRCYDNMFAYFNIHLNDDRGVHVGTESSCLKCDSLNSFVSLNLWAHGPLGNYIRWYDIQPPQTTFSAWALHDIKAPSNSVWCNAFHVRSCFSENLIQRRTSPSQMIHDSGRPPTAFVLA